MAKPINIRVAHNSVKSTVRDTDKAVLKFAKFIRKNDMKLRNFKFPSRNRMKYLSTIDLSVIGKNEKGGFTLSLPTPFGVATDAMLGRLLNRLSIATLLGTAGAWLPALVPELVNSQERQTAQAPGTREQKLRDLYEQRKNLKWWDWVTGVAQEVDEQIYFLETGQTKSYGENLTPRTPADFGPGEWTEGNIKQSLDIGKFASTISLFGILASQGAFAGGTPVTNKREPSNASNAIPVSMTMGGQINTANLGAGGLHPFPGGNRVTSEVGQRWGRTHFGTDIAETGPFRSDPRTPILAMSDGVVLEERFNDGKDAYLAGVMIKHQDLNVDARYLHMNPYVKPGDTVKRGQIIGSLVPIPLGTDPAGNTHLHLELYEPGTSNYYNATQSEKFLSGLTPVPFASINEAQNIQPNIPATPAGEPQSTSVPTQPPVPQTTKESTPQEQAVESKKKLEELTTQIQELKDSRDINRVDEKVRIPEVGTYVFGRSWWGGQEDKYFTPNGEQISKEEFEERLLKYEEKLNEQSKAEPASPQTTTVPAPSSTPEPPQDPIVTNPTTVDPVRREAPPVATYPSYNKPGRVNNTIITANQLPQGHNSPNVMSNGGPGGMTVVPMSADTAAVASAILLTQLSGS
tara:strand:- start:7246 stop:9141 length:1896 start_codon:yes stop_codon:yes gene_type:complete